MPRLAENNAHERRVFFVIDLENNPLRNPDDIDRKPICNSGRAASGKMGVISIPADQPATTPKKQRGYPRYEWKIHVATKIPNAPDYHGVFPVTVRNAENEPA